MADVPFQLCCELRGHKEDVRGVCVISESAIATSSRDKTVITWKLANDTGSSYSLDKILVGHRHFVGPVAWLRPCPKFPSGALLSGGMDKQVLVWDVEAAAILVSLEGHSEVVTDVTGTESGDVISSSQDKTVRVWRNGTCAEVLTGHESAVQAVVAMPSGEVVTGSSDCTVKIWRGTECIHTVQGHSDTVRALALMDQVGVVSSSHDGSVRLWTQSGQPLLEMVGHTALVYSVATHGTEIASGSEDNTVKIWKDGSCQQSIQHPGCVWAVAYLPNGDLVSACADGVARVWTKNEKRVAASDVLESFEAQLSATRRSKTVGNVKVEDLPGLEALQEPGKKDGQHKVIREGDAGIAYSWNAKEYNWEKIGEVVDGPTDPLASRTINGMVYDHVFDVDIGDGVPPRKLSYNRGENPYDVAEKWLEEQDLPPGYKEQVVQFIVQNTGQSAPALHNTIYDPYTGGQAYVPPAQGSARSVPTKPASPVAQPPAFVHIPKKGYLLFDTAQFDGILKKLQEFNATIAANEESATLSLSELEMIRMEAILATLKDISHYKSSVFADADIFLLQKVLGTWPRAYLFPVLDLSRMMLLHPQAARRLGEMASSSKDKDFLLESLRRAGEKPAIVQNHLTGLRMAVNTFRHAALWPWINEHREEILDLFADCRESANKNVRLAWATLLLNCSVLMVETADEEGQIQVLSAALEVVTPNDSQVDVQFRALQSIGTLVLRGCVKAMALDLDIHSVIGSAEQSKAPEISGICRELRVLLS